MKPESPPSFLSGVFWNTALMALVWPLGVAVGVVVGRWLGPAGKGEYTLALVAATLLFTIFNLGVPGSIPFWLAAGRMPENSLVKVAASLAALLSALAISIAFLLDQTGWCSYLFGVPRLSRAMWLAVLGLPFQFAGTFLQFVILAQGRRILFAAVPAVAQVLGATVIAMLLLSGKLTPLTAVGAQVVSQAVPASILLVHTQLRLRWRQAPFLALHQLRELGSYSLLNHLANVFQFLVQRIDVLMVSAFLDLRAVGLYSVAYGVAELLLLLPQRFGVLYLPRIAAEQAPLGKAEEVRQSSSLVFLGSVAAAAILSTIAPFGIRSLYGPAFAPSVKPFFLLLPGICVLATASIHSAYLAGVGRVATNAAVSAAGLVLNVALNLALIPRLGVPGAATASSLTYCAQAFCLTLAVARITRAKPLAMFTSASSSLVAGILRRVVRPKLGLLS